MGKWKKKSLKTYDKSFMNCEAVERKETEEN